MELEPVIGLEIHMQLKTKSKMFCSCPNISSGEPNSAICPICMGYPGTLPVPNGQAITWTQLMGAALNCELSLQSKFDRKSYFYPDLPKGYQISQYDQPFCREGYLSILIDGNPELIGIERIHLEEDAAKNIHPKGAEYTLIDYNRAGTPLMEMVTKPNIRSPYQARIFLQELQRIARALGVSDANMEEGNMRCDANISMREKGSRELHPKTEIKNINSFKFVEKALQYEIERQTKLWEEGAAPQKQSTRGYMAEQNKTYEQRTKEEAADYRYFPEPDIPPFVYTAKQLQEIKLAVPELPLDKEERFQQQFRTSSDQTRILSDHPRLADFFESVISELQQLDNQEIAISAEDVEPLTSRAANIILRELRDAIGQNDVPKTVTPANFAELVVLVHQGSISTNAVVPVLEHMVETGGDPDHIVANLGLKQISDSSELESVVQAVMREHEEVVAKIKDGKESAIQALVGQVMKKTKGSANPSVVMEIIKKEMEKI